VLSAAKIKNKYFLSFIANRPFDFIFIDVLNKKNTCDVVVNMEDGMKIGSFENKTMVALYRN
jgi:hypothetical protein